MNQLKKANPQLIYSNYLETNKLKLPSPYDKNYALFIQHALAVVATITLRPNAGKTAISAKATLTRIPNEGIGEFERNDLIALVKLFAEVPRSWFIKDMKKNPQLGTLTPLFMYAHKLYPQEGRATATYDMWDQNDPMIEYALGKFLHKAWLFQKEYPSIMSVGFDSALRRNLLKDRSWVDYPRFLEHRYITDATEDEPETIVYPKEWLIIDCQFWLANAERRAPEAMLLDMKHWGNTPKALDVEPLKKDEVQDIFAL